MFIDLSQLSSSRIYHTITQSLIPRPVAWVLSENATNSFNLAPFSYFSAVSSDPPLLMLSIGEKPDGSPKDSRVNIIERSHCVIHIAPASMAEAVTESSRTLAAGDSELDRLDLELAAFEGASLPRLADCPVAMACELYRAEQITSKQMMILVELKQLYLADALLEQDAQGRMKIDARKINPLARLGGDQYGLLGEVINIPRPK